MSKLNKSRDGKFVTSIHDASIVLTKLNLLRGKNLSWRKASEDFLKVSKQDDYKLMYDTAVNHMDYNLILEDGSMFQFEKEANDDLRFAYIQTPYNYISFCDFLLSFNDEQEIPTDLKDLQQLKILYETDYEQMLAEQGCNSRVSYFRYDVDSARYMPNIHSYAHLHVGIGNDIRIPCATILTPVAFVVFVIKQVYKDSWESCLKDDAKKEIVLHYAQDRILLDDEKWNDIERKELALV